MLAIAIGASSYRKGQRIQDRNEALVEGLQSLRQDSVEVRESNGRLVSEKDALVVTLDDLKFNQVQEIEDYKKKLDIEGVKNKKLRDINEVLFSAQGDGSVVMNTDTVYIDSVQQINNSFDVDDGFLSFRAWLEGQDVGYTYTYTDSLYISSHKERKNIFKPYNTVVTASLSNPQAQVTGIKSVSIITKPPKLVFGISIGLGVTNKGTSPFIGIGVTKPIFNVYR